MKLKSSGTIEIEVDGIKGYCCSYTQQGDWCVSRLGSHIGYVDTLDEVPGLIGDHLKKVRAELRRITRLSAETKKQIGLLE